MLPHYIKIQLSYWGHDYSVTRFKKKIICSNTKIGYEKYSGQTVSIWWNKFYIWIQCFVNVEFFQNYIQTGKSDS